MRKRKSLLGVVAWVAIPLFFVMSVIMSCVKTHDRGMDFESQYNISSELVRIDELMLYDPDSALMSLRSFTPEEDKSYIFNLNYQWLMISEALFKTDNTQDCRDELQTSMHYFDSLYSVYYTSDRLAMLSVRSHYMNGVGLYETDFVVDACREYLNTLDIMRSHFDDDELTGFKAKFMGLIYTRLGETFYEYNIPNDALCFYKNALTYFSRVPNMSLASTYKNIGSSYCLESIFDSALYYYKISSNLAKEQNKIPLYDQALLETAYAYYELGYMDSSNLMVRESFMLSNKDDLSYLRYFMYGMLLTNEGQYDSAIYYLKKSIKRDYYATQTISAEFLMNCYQALGDTDQMLYYKKLYGENINNYITHSSVNIELEKVYNNYRQTLSQHELSYKERKQKHGMIVALVLISIFVITAAAIVIKKMDSVKRKSYDDIKEKDNALTEMKRKIGDDGFVSEEICKTIQEIVGTQQFKSKVNFEEYKYCALDKNQLRMLRNAVDKHYDSLTHRLVKKYPELTTDDVDYCCLYFLGLRDTDISVLMQRSYRTILDRNKKLKRIFETENTVKGFLHEMVLKNEK